MPLAAGAQFGPYRIITLLGAGGMGEVYRAQDTRLDRDVALKILTPSAAGDADRRSRFEREARAVAALNHPHICTLHDVGPGYLVMEYVEGAPLAGPLPVDEVIRLAVQMADALESAHAKGIIHRDLKPANILLTRSGVKLLDFGLAKLERSAASESTVTQTQAGVVLGTAAYMSPEQVEAKTADARSDIFSLGLVLYEMISGRRAFGAEGSIAAMAAILHREPEPLPVPELWWIVSRCIRKAPADRFQTMAQLKAALAEAQPSTAKTAAAPQRPASIAVLPFWNMSGDPENEYFSDGLAQDVIDALTKVRGLKVAARTSAFAFKGRNQDIRHVGEVLGVAHVLEGSVRKTGSRVRITAQLIAIGDGCLLWSERYDREMNDLFALQDEISQAIAGVLELKLSGVDARRAASPEAYRAYLDGRYHFNQLTAAGLMRSRERYQRAIELDPEYAAPHAGLAESYIYLTLYGALKPDDAIPIAERAAELAVSLDPSAPEGYLARGFVRAAGQRRWEEAKQDFEKALELHPESALGHFRIGSWYHLPMLRTADVVLSMRRAIELDPMSLPIRSLFPMALHLDGQNEAAIREARAVAEAYPDAFFACFGAGMTLGGCGLLEEAEVILQRGLLAAPNNPWLLAMLATVHRAQGNTASPVRILERLRAAPPGVAPSTILAVVHAAAGQLETALDLMDQSLTERDVWTLPVLLAPLTGNYFTGPRYHALLRKMGIPVRTTASE